MSIFKKIIASLLTFVLVMAVIPVFAVDGNDLPEARPYTAEVYAEDAVVDEAAKTVEVYIDVANVYALCDLEFDLVYPNCLTLTNVLLVYNSAPSGYHMKMPFTWSESDDPTAFAETVELIEGLDPYETLGADPEMVEIYGEYPYFCTAANLRTTMKWASVREITVSLDTDDTVFAKEDGCLLKLIFSYDKRYNTSETLPLTLLPYKPDYKSHGIYGMMDPIAYPYINYRFYGANITVPSLSTCAHEYSVETVAQPANCKSLGEITYKCALCGAEKSEIYYRGHDYHEISGEATCTHAGYYSVGCYDCGSTYVSVNVISALGHNPFAKYTIEVQPTKDAPGVRGHLCQRCGEMCDEEEVAYLPGDVSGDGLLNLKDVPSMKDALAGSGDVVFVNIDLDGDDLYTLKDLIALKKLLAG